MRLWLPCVLALLGLACSTPAGFEAGLPPGAFEEDVLSGGASGRRALVRLAGDFYRRLEGRRFDSIATYQDPALREYFHSVDAYADYYADLAQLLRDSHFEASRPTRVELLALDFESPDRARVAVRLVGEHGLPLRWWETHVAREDRWERSAGRWWIMPGKL